MTEQRTGEAFELGKRFTPVTVTQKERVAEAARLSGMDMAEWARPLLLQAAEDVIAQHADRK